MVLIRCGCKLKHGSLVVSSTVTEADADQSAQTAPPFVLLTAFLVKRSNTKYFVILGTDSPVEVSQQVLPECRFSSRSQQLSDGTDQACAEKADNDSSCKRQCACRLCAGTTSHHANGPNSSRASTYEFSNDDGHHECEYLFWKLPVGQDRNAEFWRPWYGAGHAGPVHLSAEFSADVAHAESTSSAESTACAQSANGAGLS